jgi:hypothetical protein
MIIRLLIAAAILYALYRFVKLVQSKPPQQRRSYYITLLVSMAAAGLILLSITGRVHWLAGLVGGAMPFVRQYVLQHIYHKISNKPQGEAEPNATTPPPQMDMDESQALSVLGLKAGASDDDIIAAHRSLMQKFHPDRGGNDFLASQLNAAKDVLLNKRTG